MVYETKNIKEAQVTLYGYRNNHRVLIKRYSSEYYGRVPDYLSLKDVTSLEFISPDDYCDHLIGFTIITKGRCYTIKEDDDPNIIPMSDFYDLTDKLLDLADDMGLGDCDSSRDSDSDREMETKHPLELMREISELASSNHRMISEIKGKDMFEILQSTDKYKILLNESNQAIEKLKEDKKILEDERLEINKRFSKMAEELALMNEKNAKLLGERDNFKKELLSKVADTIKNL